MEVIQIILRFPSLGDPCETDHLIVLFYFPFLEIMNWLAKLRLKQFLFFFLLQYLFELFSSNG